MKSLYFFIIIFAASCGGNIENFSLVNATSKQFYADSIFFYADLHADKQAYFFYFDNMLQSHPPFVLERKDTMLIRQTKPILLINAANYSGAIVFPGSRVIVRDSLNVFQLSSKTGQQKTRELNFLMN